MTFFKVAFLSIIVALSGSLPAAAEAPAAVDPAARQIESFYGALLSAMKRGPELGVAGRYNQLQTPIDAAFDLRAMTQFTVGLAWAAMSDADHTALTTAFRRMTIANYAANFDKFSGQSFTVDPNVLVRGSDKLVQTKLNSPGSDSVALIYRMRQSGPTWKIIDVYLAGFASELAMRRSEYASTVASGGASALSKKLNELADSLMKGTKKASAAP
ncbi:MAG: ABC transporter substrate-binding protein [Proteobacteria bacterium]|nr:ABC transporter substrate-binding protein [Pseudomonadota bacterium]